MHTYEAKHFEIPTIEGISERSIQEHLGLYQGYVKNFNTLSALIPTLAAESEKHAHELSEIVRRRSFEFCGMRLHELYFAQLEGGLSAHNPQSPLGNLIATQFGSIETLIQQLKGTAMIRGPGWALLYFDPEEKQLLIGFAGEQHQGHFATLPIILALDVWEHAYLLDHGAAGKGAYIDAFIKHLNWPTIEARVA